MTASGRSEVSQIRTKRENETVSIGSRVTLRTDGANETLAGLNPHTGRYRLTYGIIGGVSHRDLDRFLEGSRGLAQRAFP